MPPNDERFVLDSLESPEIPRVDDRFALDQIEKSIELSPLEQFVGEENPLMREVARKGSSILRGGAVPMLGARTAMMLPGTPLQKAIYGTVGGLGLPLAELGAIGLQKLGYDVGSPYEAIQKFYTDMGLPESQTDIEKDLEMFSASFAGVKPTAQMFKKAGSGLGVSPGLQATASGTGGLTTQELINQGVDPTTASLLGVGTSLGFGLFAPRKAVGTSAFEKKLESGQLYDFAEKAGLRLGSGKTNTLLNDIVSQAKALDIDVGTLTKNKSGMYTNVTNSLTPTAVLAINKLNLYRNKPLSLKQLENMRRTVSGAIAKANANDQRILIGIRDKIDDFVENADASTFISGKKPTTEATDALRNARNLWRQASKVDSINEIFRSADLRSATSQADFEQILKSKLVTLANNKKQFNKFSQVERDAIEDVIKGGSFTKFMKKTENLMKDSSSAIASGGLGLTLDPTGIGAGAAIVPRLLSGVAGEAADISTRSSAANLENILRLGRRPTLLEAAESRLINPALITAIGASGAGKGLLYQ